MKPDNDPMCTRKVIYAAMIILLCAIAVAARNEADPIYLAVGLIGEIILVATAHLSSVIQHYGRSRDLREPH